MLPLRLIFTSDVEKLVFKSESFRPVPAKL